MEKKKKVLGTVCTNCDFISLTITLMLVYHCHKPVFTPKITIFQRAGMRENFSIFDLYDMKTL